MTDHRQFEDKSALVVGAMVPAVTAIAKRLGENCQTLLTAGPVGGVPISEDFPHSVIDTAIPSAWEQYSRRLRKEVGSIDLLVLCPGALIPSGGQKEIPDSWEIQTAASFTGTFAAFKYLIPLLLESGDGRVLVVTSSLAWSARPGSGSCCAIEAGTLSLAQTLALETSLNGRRACRINAIATSPSLVWPHMAVPLSTEQAPCPTKLEEFVEAALFLLARESQAIAGHCLVADSAHS